MPERVVVLAEDEARALKHNYVGTEHILLGLVRENEGVAARILLDLDADAENIHNEIIRMLSGPAGTTTTAHRRQPRGATVDVGRPRLRIACPACATPIEALTIDQRNAAFHVSMEGGHTCTGCGRRWTISSTATWSDPSAPVHPDDDLPSRASVGLYSKPAHFAMTCLRCDLDLERIRFAETTPPIQVEGDGDRTCPGCGKHWQIAYAASWDERLG